MTQNDTQCAQHNWCEVAGPHLTHSQQDRTIRLSALQDASLSVVAIGDDPERMIHLFGVRLTLSEARSLGGALVDVSHRFN